MRNFFLCLLALWRLTPIGVAEDWRGSLDVKPGKFPALRPLVARYDFGWSGLKAAEAEARFFKDRRGFRLKINGRTVGFPRSLWRMDTEAVSTVNAETLHALSLDQSERYARKSFKTRVDFTPSGVLRLKVPTPPDASPAKRKRFKFSNTHDLHSALLFIRSQRLRMGDSVRLCVYPATSAYFAEVRVIGRKKVKAAGREWSAILCEIHLRELGRDFALVPHSKFKKARAWISDDADRVLLRVEADVFIGHVWMEMRSVKFSD